MARYEDLSGLVEWETRFTVSQEVLHDSYDDGSGIVKTRSLGRRRVVIEGEDELVDLVLGVTDDAPFSVRLERAAAIANGRSGS